MRHKSYLRHRYRTLVAYTGAIALVIGVLMQVPLLVIPFYPNEVDHAGSFLLAGLPLIIVGLLLWLLLKPKEVPHLTAQEGAVIVVFVWAMAILVGMIPLMMSLDLTFSQAIFEATSGWTTTGLSVVDVTEAPRIILFYRSFLQLAGGAGFAIIALSAITGSFSAGLVGAEGRPDQLAPNIRHSANIVLTMYSGYMVLGVIALRVAGMDWFDAVNHAFTAVSTGGFSTQPQSIGYWDSPAVEAVIVVLMLLGSINFVVAYTFLKGKLRVGIRSGELHLLAALLVVGTGLLLLFVSSDLYPSIEKSVRVSLFEITSAVTTTGFATVDYRPWPPIGWLVLIVLMLIGGGTGSTSGGIKQFRVYIIYKAIRWELRKAFLPRHILNEPSMWQGENRSLLSDRRMRQIAIFIGAYLVVFLVGSGLMMIYGYSMQDSLFEFASALGTVGLSVGVTSPDMPASLLWLQSVAMVLGRLEIFTVIIGIVKLALDTRTLIPSHA